MMTAATNYTHLLLLTAGKEEEKNHNCEPRAVCVELSLVWLLPSGDDSFLITSGGPWRRRLGLYCR